MKKLFIVIVLCLSAGCAFTQGNLVQNGGFEDGDANWSLFGDENNITYSIDNTSALEGTNCLKAELAELGADPWSIQIKNGFGPVEKDHLYRATIWVKSATSGSTINYTIGKATAGYDEYASTYGVEISTEWTKYTLEFTAQVSTSDDITLALHITSTDTYWFDDFKVVEMTGEVSDATVDETGNRILLEFAMNLAEPNEDDQLPFFVYSQQRDYEVSNVTLSNKSTELNLVLAEPIFEGENITVEYIPGTLRTTAGVEISAFSIEALNNSKVPNSISNTNENQQFKIYPIPFIDQITIENQAGQSVKFIKILDSYGRTILQHSELFESETLQMDLDFLNPGMYIIVIESKNGIVSVSKITKK